MVLVKGQLQCMHGTYMYMDWYVHVHGVQVV